MSQYVFSQVKIDGCFSATLSLKSSIYQESLLKSCTVFCATEDRSKNGVYSKYVNFRRFPKQPLNSFLFYGILQQELIRKMCGEGGVLVTSYSGMRQHQDHLLSQRIDYVILDEGHKIRNPDAEITLACKQVRCYSCCFRHECHITHKWFSVAPLYLHLIGIWKC